MGDYPPNVYLNLARARKKRNHRWPKLVEALAAANLVDKTVQDWAKKTGDKLRGFASKGDGAVPEDWLITINDELRLPPRWLFEAEESDDVPPPVPTTGQTLFSKRVAIFGGGSSSVFEPEMRNEFAEVLGEHKAETIYQRVADGSLAPFAEPGDILSFESGVVIERNTVVLVGRKGSPGRAIRYSDAKASPAERYKSFSQSEAPLSALEWFVVAGCTGRFNGKSLKFEP